MGRQAVLSRAVKRFLALDVGLIELEVVQNDGLVRAGTDWWRRRWSVAVVIGDVTVATDVILVIVISYVIYDVIVSAHRLLVGRLAVGGGPGVALWRSGRRDGSQAPRHQQRCNTETERRRHGNQDDVGRRSDDTPCCSGERPN